MAEAPAAPAAEPAPAPAHPRWAASAPTTALQRRAIDVARRCAGALLIALSIVPVWRLLGDEATGLAGAATVALMRDVSGLAWSGTLLALIPLVALVFLGARLSLAARLARVARRIEAVPVRAFALAIGALATAAALAFGFGVLDAQPNLIDAMTQLAHARLIAAGRLAGPSEFAEFHFITNSVLTDAGWVSQYPPGHAALLALGMIARAEWLVGPLSLGVALTTAVLIGERTLPHARVAVRSLLLLACVSPFLLAHAGSYMNHTTAAAFAGVAILSLLHARDGDARWAVAAGLAASLALAIRPLSALAMIGAAALAAWLPAPDRAWLGRRIAYAVAGALPLTLLHLWYNAHFFGGPLTLGYVAAFGPAHGLGLGLDPWGNRYGALEAAAYTSADLSALSLALFEVPLPLVAIAGAFLLLAPRLRAGERVVAAWAIAPVAANVLYWHHGNFMGPRMLNEATPAWVLLVALALAWLVRSAPKTVRLGGDPRPFRPALAAAFVLVAIASAVWLVPARLASSGGPLDRTLRHAAADASAPALVFVHGPWASRVAARLSAAGMRSDSLETALRQNSTCAVEQFADSYEARAATPTRAATPNAATPPLDLTPAAERALPRVEISAGNYIRVRPGEALSGRCASQIDADRLGVLELAPLLWRGAPPGSERGVLYARDMGPARNRRLIESRPARTPWLYAAASADSAARLMPYDEGMQLVWRSTPGTPQVAR